MDKTLAYIKKVGNEYVVFSHSGKRLGSYSTKEAAEERLRTIEYFKHKGKGNMAGTIAGTVHANVIDGKDHFPIHSVTAAQNAILRVSKICASPDWFSGNVAQLKQAVLQSVAVKYPDLRVSVQTSAKAALILGRDTDKIQDAVQDPIYIDKTLAGDILKSLQKRKDELDTAMSLAQRLASSGVSGEEFTNLSSYLQTDVLYDLMSNGTKANRNSALQNMVATSEKYNPFLGPQKPTSKEDKKKKDKK